MKPTNLSLARESHVVLLHFPAGAIKRESGFEQCSRCQVGITHAEESYGLGRREGVSKQENGAWTRSPLDICMETSQRAPLNCTADRH